RAAAACRRSRRGRRRTPAWPCRVPWRRRPWQTPRRAAPGRRTETRRAAVSSRSSLCRSFLPAIVGGKIGHVLVAHLPGDAAHAGMGAVAGLVGPEGADDVLLRLPGDLGHVVHHRVGGMVVGDAVAAHAHGVLLLARGGRARGRGLRPGGAAYHGSAQGGGQQRGAGRGPQQGAKRRERRGVQRAPLPRWSAHIRLLFWVWL